MGQGQARSSTAPQSRRCDRFLKQSAENSANWYDPQTRVWPGMPLSRRNSARRPGWTNCDCVIDRLAATSRDRITAIVNRNTIGISTDLMLRLLYSLGYTATVKFHRTA